MFGFQMILLEKLLVYFFSITFFDQILHYKTFWKRSLGCLQLHCSTRYFSRGTELFDATLSNEAMHQRGKQDLASLVYLQILIGLKLLIKLLYCVVLHKKWNIFFHNFGA